MTNCPKCQSDKGFDIVPSFQFLNDSEVRLSTVSCKCKSCGIEYPIMNIHQITEKLDKTFDLLQEIRSSNS